MTAVASNHERFHIPTVRAYFKLHRDPRIEKPFTTPGYPYVPLIFLGAAVFIVVNTRVTSPVQAMLSLLLIGLGVPVYYWQAKRAGVHVRREPVLAPLAEKGP